MVLALLALATPGWADGLPDRYVVDTPWWERGPPAPPQATLPPAVRPVALGEFEPGDGLLVVSWEADLDPTMVPMVAAAAAAGWPVVACERDPEQGAANRAALAAAGVDPGRIFWPSCPLDTVWVRDFGPLVLLDADGGRRVGDMRYARYRPQDDAFPQRFGAWIGAPVHDVPLRMEGGNLLPDGRGGCLSTHALYDGRAPVDRAEAERHLAATAGCDRVTWLEPLPDEATGHVDMFLTLVDADTVLLGEADPETSPGAAAALDANAEVLRAAGYEVLRLPMPPAVDLDGDNVIDHATFLNGLWLNDGERRLWLYPAYPDAHPALGEAVAAQLEAALPGVEAVPVPAEAAIVLGGALHCLARVVPAEGWPDPCGDAWTFNDGECVASARCGSAPGSAAVGLAALGAALSLVRRRR